MNTYNSIKTDLIKIGKDVSNLLINAKSMPGMSDDSLSVWENTAKSINRQLTEEIIRVAVVGPIKSGKSTFINSLFKGEYLKRGAGVVTSIVTRVRSGEKLRAKLLFKSWDEINADMDRALSLLPSPEWWNKDGKFDIRHEKERMNLQKALISLDPEYHIAYGTRNVNSVLLSSYLKGFDRVNELISLETNVKEYEDNLFGDHWNFVGDGDLAVYLKDVHLEINTGGIESNIEIADCQGSDSPNPLHLALIQDYLLLTNLIIYVISSRTGLREADIKFLSLIKKMGIMDNILFIINCDFSEHDSLSDLNHLIDKVKEETTMVAPSPEIFSMSALFNLFKAQNSNLLHKDRLRLEQWQGEKEVCDFSNAETARFKTHFYNKLTHGSYTLLLKNHIERLYVISSGLEHWISFNHNILSKNFDNANEIAEDVKKHRVRINQIKSVIKSTLDGSVQQINQELKREIDGYFDVRSGNVTRDIAEFIKGYPIVYQQYGDDIKTSGFSNTLFQIFHEFKQDLDTFMAETINPEIIRFVKKQEARIHEHLESIAGPFDVMVQDAIFSYNDMMGELGINRSGENLKTIHMPDIGTVKSIAGLSLPPMSAYMRYTAKMKTEATMRLGLYKVVNIFKRLLKKPIQGKNQGEILALRDGILRMKHEMEKSVIYHLKDYQENIKFQYLYKLVKAESDSLYESLLDRFQVYGSDLSSIVDLINNKLIDKEQTSEQMTSMALDYNKLNEKIKDLRQKIDTIESADKHFAAQIDLGDDPSPVSTPSENNLHLNMGANSEQPINNDN
jgi:GTPase SAR1 family protein